MNTFTSNDRVELISIVWDLYKDCYNVRPRFMDFNSMTVADLQAQIQSLMPAIEASVQEDKEYAAAEKAAVVSVCAEQNISLATYNRWMVEA